MAYQKKAYLEHSAIRVKDIDWYIRFFKEALNMPIRKIDGAKDNPRQIWTIGGIQLIADPNFSGIEGRLAHLGIMVEDLEAAMEEVYKWNVTELPKGHNWVVLPDGLSLELIQAKEGSVEEALTVYPWMED